MSGSTLASAAFNGYALLGRLAAPLIRSYLRRRLAQGREDAARLPERLGQAGKPRPGGARGAGWSSPAAATATRWSSALLSRSRGVGSSSGLHWTGICFVVDESVRAASSGVARRCSC